jgi:hypothetical protein
MHSVSVLGLQSAVVIAAHPVKLSGSNAERAMVGVLYAFVNLPFSEVKGAKTHFD